MTDTLQAVLLAVVQGVTEFLPISSAAHLILPAQLLGWPDQGLGFDVAVHVGSLVAVLAYFRRDLRLLLVGSWQSLRTRTLNQSSTMVLFLVVATIPAGLSGLLLKDIVATELRTVQVIAATTLLFGLLLGFADRRSSSKTVNTTATASLNWRSVGLIGLAQALAIVPGTSRSGITMTAALWCGLGREEAARFSFLLSIPIITAAGLLQTLELSRAGVPVNWTMMMTGGLVSAVTAYLCIRWFLALIGRIGFMPFVIYRIALGSVLIWIGW